MCFNKLNLGKFILFYTKINCRQALFSIGYTILNAVMPAFETIVLANFINSAIQIFEGNSDPNTVVVPIILLLFYVFFTNFMPEVSELVDLKVKNKITVYLKKILLEKRSKLEYFHVENAKDQDLINRVCSDPTEIFMDGFKNILTTVYLVISSLSILLIIFSIQPISAIAIMGVTIPLFYLSLKTGRKNYELGKEHQKIKRQYSYISEMLMNREYANERALFRYSDVFSEKYSGMYDDAFKIESKIEKKRYANMKSGSLVTLLLIFIILLLLIPNLKNRTITIGTFIALANASLSLVQNMSWKLSVAMMEHSKLNEYLKDWNLFFALSEKSNADIAAKRDDNFRFESLEFVDVSFKYPNTDTYILKNCSFKMQSKKKYALVGVNGAGKSTIIKLITGMYNDYSGKILLNARDIKEYDYATLKGIISVVFQDFCRYETTVKDNIIVGKSFQYDQNEVGTIMDKLELNDLKDKLKNGLDTPIGKAIEEGVDLSGGQWQKLAIARLLYSDSQINILDEPTAALDPIAESNMYKLFDRISDEKFVIYITHRLGAIKMVDEILLVQEGCIAEKGTHKALMEAKRLYYDMYSKQQKWYKENA